MATELDVSRSHRFDIAMSRRTRRSTSLAACFHDQYVPPLTQHHHQDAKLKTSLQCQDAEPQGLQQFEHAEQQTPCLCEDEKLKIPHAPQQYEGDEQKTLEQYQDEQEKEPQQYPDEEQKKPEQYLDEEKTPQHYQYEDEKASKCHDEEQTTPRQHEDDGDEKTPEQYQDEEQKAPQQCQESDEPASEQYEEEEEKKARQERHDTEQKMSEQCQGTKNLSTPPCVIEGVPRFSLQELIQEKQLTIGEVANRLGGHGKNVLADHKVSGGGAGAAAATTGGTTLAMVIRRPEGGKKSIGMIRRCVKALNQMIKTKHGSKKNIPL